MTDAAFDHAMELHSQGRVDEAMALYQQIVEADPNHAGAIHLLGVALSQKGQFPLAAQFIQSAILLNGTVPEYHINLGNALTGAHEYRLAEQAYANAVALNSSIPEAWFGMGNARSLQGRPQEGIDAYMQAIELRPDFVEALVNMGGLLVPLGRLDEAVAALAHAASLRPLEAKPRYLLAQALEAAGHPDEAATLYVSLAELSQCPVSLLFDVGKRLAALNHHSEAVIIYKAALTVAPSEMVLWNNMANSLRDLDQLSEAKSAYTQAFALAPNDAGVLSNLGTVLKDLGDLSEAVRILRQAIALGGGVMAHSNLGHALYLQGHIADAAHCFDAALTISPNDPDALFHRGVVNLLMGNWTQGWQQYEARWFCRRTQERRRHDEKEVWDGGNLSGKTILLWSEQGLGDTLHFIRFAEQVAAKGGRVIVECQPALVSLLESMPSVAGVFAVGDELPDFDVQAPLLSLPHLLGLTIENLPQTGPYLAPPADRVDLWREWNKTDLPRIGIVWSGESRRQNVECVLIDRRRSIMLDTLAPVLALPGLQFVSLQLGPARAQLNRWEKIFDPAGRIRDFADTAALISHLDLVISVDTSVAHLAAALGKPVMLLSRFDGCWRWLQGRTDSPWYPTVKLYSQPSAGDWVNPVAALAQDVTRWVECRD